MTDKSNLNAEREQAGDMDTQSSADCVVIRPNSTYAGKQGFSYFSGISTETAGSTSICMHTLTIPPGGRARPHLHENHETAIYVISGEAGMWYGQKLENYLTMGPGEFLHIPAGVPHLPANLSDTDPCVAVVARTDPNEQESVVLLDIEAPPLSR